MSDETYNGWTGKGNKASASATWRVALEMFDGYNLQDDYYERPDVEGLATSLEEQTREYVDQWTGDDYTMIRGWVDAFLDDVNWEEIAENILSDWDD
jgi:hypothetical protein